MASIRSRARESTTVRGPGPDEPPGPARPKAGVSPASTSALSWRLHVLFERAEVERRYAASRLGRDLHAGPFSAGADALPGRADARGGHEIGPPGKTRRRHAVVSGTLAGAQWPSRLPACQGRHPVVARQATPWHAGRMPQTTRRRHGKSVRCRTNRREPAGDRVSEAGPDAARARMPRSPRRIDATASLPRQPARPEARSRRHRVMPTRLTARRRTNPLRDASRALRYLNPARTSIRVCPPSDRRRLGSLQPWSGRGIASGPPASRTHRKIRIGSHPHGATPPAAFRKARRASRHTTRYPTWPKRSDISSLAPC